MRQSDLLLSLMLSPHPSYPPLEMAACGRPVVTTTFGAKTAERLRALSPHIIATLPTIEGVAGGLEAAVLRLSLPGQGEIDLPGSWSEAFSRELPRILRAFAEVVLSRRSSPRDGAP
jgi:hypothetical protein